MANWLKDCEICNAGLCATVDNKKREGKTERAACREMSEESGGLYSYRAILNRYRYYTGRDKGVLDSDNDHFRTSFTGENEWYTPLVYVEAAREVMGTITLDPATSEYGQSRIKAEYYFTAEDDGLKEPWIGKIWLNPPYSNPLLSEFIDKAVSEYQSGNITEAIILTHNYTDTKWFHKTASACSMMCFTLGRIKFEDKDRNLAAPTQGSAFFYFGVNPERFKRVFEQFGFIR